MAARPCWPTATSASAGTRWPCSSASRELVAPDGRVVVDVAPWGTGVVTRHVRLETSHGRSGEFPWTAVGADAIQAVACAAGLGTRDHPPVRRAIRSFGEVWFR